MSNSEALQRTERPLSKRRMSSYDDDKDEQPDSAGSGIAGLALNIVTFPLRPLRPLLPHLFPILVCLLSIPVLMFFSGAAGWVVWSNVPVGWKADVFLQYGEAANPFATVKLPPILADQPYDISLHLVLPTTESNYALGNFMATLRLSNDYNETLNTVRRPAVLVSPRSSLLKQLLIGSPATTKVDIPLVAEFTSGTSVVHARLELGRSDAWKGLGSGQGRELSVLEATLKGTVRPTGILAILARYPRLTTFASTFTFFFVSLLVVCGFLFTAFRTDSSSLSQQPPSPTGNSDGNDSPDEKPYPRRQLVRRESVSHSATSSGSSSSAQGDEKPRQRSSNDTTIPISAIRRRKPSPTIDTDANGSASSQRRSSQVKIEDIQSLRGTIGTPPLYPKSPYPRPESAGSVLSLQRQSPAAESYLASPSEADAESSGT